MTAASLLRDTAGAYQQSYAILVHVKSANFVLGICAGDDTRLNRDDSESFLRYGVEHGTVARDRPAGRPLRVGARHPR